MAYAMEVRCWPHYSSPDDSKMIVAALAALFIRGKTSGVYKESSQKRNLKQTSQTLSHSNDHVLAKQVKSCSVRK